MVRAAKVRAVSKPAARNLWELRLYIYDAAPRSLLAFDRLKAICEEHLPGRYRIEVLDLQKNPELARRDNIVIIPTVVRKNPLPPRTLVGDLADTGRALARLDFGPLSSAPEPPLLAQHEPTQDYPQRAGENAQRHRRAG